MNYDDTKEEAIAKIRLRLLDIYAGAYGKKFSSNTEAGESIILSGDLDEFQRFLDAIIDCFPDKKFQNTSFSVTFTLNNLSRFETMDSTALWLFYAWESAGRPC